MSYTPPPMPHEAASNRFQGVFLFKDRVTAFLPSAKTIVIGRFLPSFNWALPPSDPAFAVGWAPYRDKNQLHPKSGLAIFSRWAVSLDIFDGLGPEGRDTIISNNSRIALLGAETVSQADRLDAFTDVYRLASERGKTDPVYKSMVETERQNQRPLVPHATTKVMFNIMGVKDRAWEVGPMGMSYSGWAELTRLADQFPNPVEPVLDPEWNFMYGDFTSPLTGLQFSTCQVLAANRKAFNAVQFSPQPNTVQGVIRLQAPESILAKRINLWDPSVYNWFSYQEQVDYMVNNTMIPMDLINEACSMRASIPQRQTGSTTTVQGYAPPQGQLPPPPGQGYAPPQGQLPPPPGQGYAPPQGQLPPPPGQGYVPPQGQLPPPPGQLPTPPSPVGSATFAPPPNYVPPTDFAAPSLSAGPVPEVSTLPPVTMAPPLPPVVAPPLPEPAFPPAGWTQHPASAAHYYCGQEVLTEADLRARMTPAAPAAPVVPAAPATAKPDYSEEAVRAALGTEADEYFRLIELSRADAGARMTGDDIGNFLKLSETLSSRI